MVNFLFGLPCQVSHLVLISILVLFQVKIVENIALGYLDNITTFGTLTGKGEVPFAY